jgi:valyl-tRNA synthetase
MKKELSKAFEPKKYEDKIYKNWEKSGFFNPDNCIKENITKENAPQFSIVLPPPNVTGTLHMGHAAMLAIEDVMIRYHRMKGDRTLWLPGTDHAAVATQSKVEKILLEEGKTRHDLGREKLLKKIEKFAEESHDTIVKQSKKMGASLDWSREAYTLDEKRNLAVRTVFKKMYDDGLIYRGFRAVNWSVKGQSTLSDDEIVYKERTGKLYTFKYSRDFPFTIATTRPETKLGDTAVAVNPQDKRYSDYIGKEFDVDFVGQKLKLKIIADDDVDMEFGTGALGVTPAHSMVDYEMANKNELPMIKVIGEDGKMTKEAGEFVGLEVLEAREKIVEKLKTAGLLEGEEEITQNVGTSDRFEDVVEVLPKLQWFVSVSSGFTVHSSKLDGIKDSQEVTLKELMQQVVKSGQIKIVPENFNKIYFNWIDNLRDWCISRQIWYGHRIPVWYCEKFRANSSEPIDCDKPIVSIEKVEKCPQCGGSVQQDEDTLDTWFSSGLWTFSTLGYPEETKDLKDFHPNSVMETGYDILFFWVARMILMTTYTLGDIPFETVYLHGLVRDEKGRKMSKSLGNTIDPLDMIEKYGTDATRLSLLIGSTPGNDMKLSEAKVEGFRNFTNKLWNISRFMLLNIDDPKSDAKKPEAKTLADKWILNLLGDIVKNVTNDIENYKFSSAGERLRDFTWNELADWYLEVAKIEKDKSEILNYILNTILKLWHPFMPFVTEQVWEEVYGKKNLLMVEKWPDVYEIKKESQDFSIIKNIITGIRALRSENKIEPAKKLDVYIFGDNFEFIKENSEVVNTLSRVDNLNISNEKKEIENAIGFALSGYEVFIDLADTVDLAKEKTRLQKEVDNIAPYVEAQTEKLSNSGFVENAPEQVVEAEKKKLSDAKEKLQKLKQQLENLK